MRRPFLSSKFLLTAAFTLVFVTNYVPQCSCLADEGHGSSFRSLANAYDENETGAGSSSGDATSMTSPPSSHESAPENATDAPTPAPIAAVTSAPTLPPPPTTSSPTKLYIPAPDPGDDGDDGSKEEEEREKHPWRIAFWCLASFGLIWAGYTFRDEIFMFCVSTWTNIRRNGCLSCLASFCPCLPYQWRAGNVEARSRGGESSTNIGPLDQIIFETEDANSNMQRGLMD